MDQQRGLGNGGLGCKLFFFNYMNYVSQKENLKLTRCFIKFIFKPIRFPTELQRLRAVPVRELIFFTFVVETTLATRLDFSD